MFGGLLWRAPLTAGGFAEAFAAAFQFVLSVCFLVLSPLIPPRQTSSTTYRTKEKQMPLLIRSLSLHPCFNTAEAEFPQRTWLICRSTNTVNYSLMPLSESQFSQRHSPVPRETDAHCCSHHCRLNKDKWGLSKLPLINKSLSLACCLSAHHFSSNQCYAEIINSNEKWSVI